MVRYGNVFGSRGSVYGIFKNFQNKGYFPITNSNMTRFNITLNQGIDVVFHAISNSFGGEIMST